MSAQQTDVSACNSFFFFFFFNLSKNISHIILGKLRLLPTEGRCQIRFGVHIWIPTLWGCYAMKACGTAALATPVLRHLMCGSGRGLEEAPLKSGEPIIMKFQTMVVTGGWSSPAAWDDVRARLGLLWKRPMMSWKTMKQDCSVIHGLQDMCVCVFFNLNLNYDNTQQIPPRSPKPTEYTLSLCTQLTPQKERFPYHLGLFHTSMRKRLHN